MKNNDDEMRVCVYFWQLFYTTEGLHVSRSCAKPCHNRVCHNTIPTHLKRAEDLLIHLLLAAGYSLKS
jgi:hypothetical protein